MKNQFLESSESTVINQVFWGTNVNVKEVMSRFRNFLNEFKLNDNTDMAGEYYYVRLLQEIKNTKVYKGNLFFVNYILI